MYTQHRDMGSWPPDKTELNWAKTSMHAPISGRTDYPKSDLKSMYLELAEFCQIECIRGNTAVFKKIIK